MKQKLIAVLQKTSQTLSNALQQLSVPVAFAVSIVTMVAVSIVTLPQMHQKYIYRKVGAKVARIVNPKNHQSGGTGFLVTAPSGNQYTLTNRHVCQGVRDGNFVEANLPDDSTRYFKLAIRDISDITDLCLLDPIPVGSGVPIASSVDLGDEIGIVGHPKLQPTTISRGMLTNHEHIQVMTGLNITDKECEERGGQNFEYNSFFGPITVCLSTVYAGRTSAIIYPGNSGSPVVNIFGNVVGVAFAGDNEMHYAYIVPLKSVLKFLENR